MSRTVSSLAAILLIASAGVPLWIFVIAAKSEARPAPPREVSAALVETEIMKMSDFELNVEAFGTLLPARRASLVAERSGRVVWVHPDWRSGLEVTAGEALLRIDPVPYELELSRSKAMREEALAGLEAASRERTWSVKVEAGARQQLKLALRELARLEDLESRGQVGASLVDQARTTVVRSELEIENARGRGSAAEAAESAAKARILQAEVMIQIAEDSLARTELSAPFAGTIEGRAPALESFLTAATPLGECLDRSKLHLVAMIHADQLAGVREGQVADLTLPSRPEARVSGTVRSVSSVVDPLTRSAAVEIEIDNSNSEAALPTGLFAQVTLHAGERKNQLWIDRRHLVWESEQPTAWILDSSGAAKSCELVLGDPLGEGFSVRSGLLAGDELITGPLDRLFDGVQCIRKEVQIGEQNL
ncbi:MAG: multidrug resistance efflux pump [Planctomycetota bacterium]|jgi:multidrug resistance efflux pump